MKRIKKICLLLFTFFVIAILFRGFIYRHTFRYQSAGERNLHLITSKSFAAFIDECSEDHKVKDVEDFIELSHFVTSSTLNYATANTSTNPNKLIDSKHAHCVGYAAFFAATCNYLLQKNRLSEYWQVKHHIGNISFNG